MQQVYFTNAFCLNTKRIYNLVFIRICMHQTCRTLHPYPYSFVLCSTNSFNQIGKPLRILTQFFVKNIDDMLDQTSKNIMQMYIYSQTDVFYGKISSNNLNKDLTWNQKLFQIMKKSLNGKTKNIKIQFNISTFSLKFWSLFNENDFKILLFSAQFINLHQNPFVHAQLMLKNTNENNKDQLKQLESINNYYQYKLQKMDVLAKQMVDQHQFEMNQIKERFVSLVNDVKKKLRPHFGIEQKKQDQGLQQSQTRTLYRIKSIKSGENRQSQNFLNLFS